MLLNAPHPTEEKRLSYQPQLPKILQAVKSLESVPSPVGSFLSDQLQETFPHTLEQKPVQFSPGKKEEDSPKRVGVVLSGGQAPGGHNVICGVYDALKKIHPGSQIYGFLNGPIGIIKNDVLELTDSIIDRYRNMGGFDMIASGRTKIETPEQFAAAAKSVKSLDLDGVVVIGGDDSNTNAALLAEYFKEKGLKTDVVGVPKTIDGDLKNEAIEVSFGFDTATKTFSSIIGNIARDCLSAKKYYYFIKLMGRSASHITLECALQTHPNEALIGEEVAKKSQTLKEVVDQICNMICLRADSGKDYGMILIPEGIIEFIPEVKLLIGELNTLLAKKESADQTDVTSQLTEESRSCFSELPRFIQEQLLLDRDSHGNVQVSKIESEKLLMEMTKAELKRREAQGSYRGTFSAQPHFCGYEGRSCLPSNFDANYCYALGITAAALLNNHLTGYVACIKNLVKKPEQWKPSGTPLVSMIHFEERHGEPKPVIEKTLVDLDGAPFLEFEKRREEWSIGDCYRYPGPIQFFGEEEIVDEVNISLKLESSQLTV